MAIEPAALAQRAGAAGARRSLVGRCDFGATVPETPRVRLPGKAVQRSGKTGRVQHQKSQRQQQDSTHELGLRRSLSGGMTVSVCTGQMFELFDEFDQQTRLETRRVDNHVP